MAKSIVTVAKTVLTRIAGLTKTATTSADHAEIVSALQDEVERELAAIRAAEARRPTIILDGGDPAALAREITDRGEALLVLQSNLATATARQQEAERRERAEQIEADAVAVARHHIPALERALVDYHAALDTVIRRGREVGEHNEAVAEMNRRIADARPDLVVNLDAVRLKVRDALAGPIDVGPPPVAKPRPERKDRPQIPGESDASHLAREEAAWQHELRKWKEDNDLRLGNHAARVQHAASTRADPFKIAGEAAIEAIETVSFPMDFAEKARNRRRADIRVYTSPDGQPIRQIAPTDGRGKGDVRLSPPRPLGVMQG